jgi:uncharacterized membrane protein
MKDRTSDHSPVPALEQGEYAPGGSLEQLRDVSTDKEKLAANIIGWVLQGGVILSASIILIGFLMLPLRPGGFSVQRFLSFPQTLGQVWAGLLVLHPQAIITLGLLLLIATPIMRVAVSIVVFALERDRRFVVITVLVLAILLLSNFLPGTVGVNASHSSIQNLHFSLITVLLIFAGSIVAGIIRDCSASAALPSRYWPWIP